MVSALEDYAAANSGAPQSFRCNSPLMPQPVALSAQQLTGDGRRDIESYARGDLMELHTFTFDTENDLAPLSLIRPWDYRLRSEDWTVTYEGVLPSTQRDDGLLAEDAEDDGSVWIDVDGLDACDAGVMEGDDLIIRTTPTGDCPVDAPDDLGDFMSYRVEEVTAHQLRIAPLDGVDGVASTVPVRSCFDQPVEYEVRPDDAWTVVGKTTGYVSSRTSRFGRCVARFGDDTGRVGGRVETGGVFQGGYLSFYLYPGWAPDEVKPVRGTSYTFGVDRGFSPSQDDIGGNTQSGNFPYDITLAPRLPGGSFLVVSDPDDNFVWVKDVDRPTQDAFILQ